MPWAKFFTSLNDRLSHWAGSPWSVLGSFALIIGWLACGPFFGFSEQWSLAINTITTVVTFALVFIIQSTQNRDQLATQTKLDELIKSSKASNALIGIDRRTEQEIEQMRDHERR